jgi:hypothetical protein
MNRLTVLGREFILRDEFTVNIDEDGIVETITLKHLFVSEVVVGLRTIHNALKMIQENAQMSANRGQGRGVPMNEFKIRIKQQFTEELAQDNWRFEFTLIFQNGEEVYDDNEDFSDDDSAEALPE